MCYFRTDNSDCCPDYSAHCEGLVEVPGDGEPDRDWKIVYQEGVGQETISRPKQCQFGIYQFEGEFWLILVL